MTPIEMVTGALALLCALLMFVCLRLALAVSRWREGYNALLDKPLTFWMVREQMRQLGPKMTLDNFAAVKPLPDNARDDKVVQFRRPPPFMPPL
jgi:hypothetical protein